MNHKPETSLFKSVAQRALISAFGILCAAQPQAFAQGTAFTYQGLLNLNGAPYSGSAEFQPTLWSVSAGGTALAGNLAGSVVVGVSNGLFVLPLDFGTNFPGADRWLELDVRTAIGPFTPLTPRQPLTPAPYATTAGNLAGTLPTTQLSGVVASANVSGTYANAVTFNNSGNTFTGSGAGLTALSAAQLASGTVPDARLAANVARTNQVWQLQGNVGTTPGSQFIGTTDNQPLEFKVNGQRGLRLEPNSKGAPNIIAGALINTVSNGVLGATISGGGATNYNGLSHTNTVAGDFGTVSGGFDNTAGNFEATVSGGYGNTASGYVSTVSGGGNNTASSTWAFVGGGSQNTASGFASTVAGGGFNVAASDYCFAAGAGAQALHYGCFVWKDDSAGAFASTTPNQFSVLATGGVVLAADVAIEGGPNAYHHLAMNGGNSEGFLYGSYLNPYLGDGIHLGYNWYADNSGTGHFINTGGGTSRITAGYSGIILAVGGVNTAPTGSGTTRLDATTTGVTVYGTFNNLSDRNAKQEFEAVDTADILDKVLRLPVSEWSYRVDASTRHIGPVAQDFSSVFNIGTDDKHIAPIDEGGVAFAAIQGLNQKLEKENAELNVRVEKLEQLINARNGGGK